MSSTVKEFLKASFLLIGAYLVLIHFTGFGADVGAVFTGLGGVDKVLQGRG